MTSVNVRLSSLPTDRQAGGTGGRAGGVALCTITCVCSASTSMALCTVVQQGGSVLIRVTQVLAHLYPCHRSCHDFA